MRERLDLNKKNDFEVINENSQNFAMIEHVIFDSLYFKTIHQKTIYMHLIRFANFNTKEAYPSKKLLAKLCCCSESTIKTNIKELEKMNLITVKERFVDGKQNSNLYIINEYPFELFDKHYKNEGGQEITPLENQGGQEITPKGSGDNPLGVRSYPLGGQEIPTKDIDLKEKDLKEKDLKNDDDKRLKIFLETNEYQLLKNTLIENGFNENQILAIQKKIYSERKVPHFALKPEIIKLAIQYYVEGLNKTNISSIAGFFHYQLEKAINDWRVERKQAQMKIEEYENALKEKGENEFNKYNWLES